MNQTLLNVSGLPTLWASSLSAVVLGVLSAAIALRMGYPQQGLALVGFTGALLPGIPVFFGILQQMSGGSGASSFGAAAATCVGIGAGVSIGMYLVRLARLRAAGGGSPR